MQDNLKRFKDNSSQIIFTTWESKNRFVQRVIKKLKVTY